MASHEALFIEDHRDLITLRASSAHAHVGAFIESMLNRVKNWISSKAERVTGSSDKAITLQEWLSENGKSEQLAGRFIATGMFFVVSTLFVVPIYALSVVGDNISKSISILVVSALTFTALMLVATPAKQHEVLSSSAA